MALKFSDIDENATSVKVGLNPSMGTGLVEIIDDPDKNGVFKIANTDQVFQVVTTVNGHKNYDTYSLRGLVLDNTGA